LRRSTLFRWLFVTGLGFLCAAPTPGDIGGCGQQPQPLDATLFFAEKTALDCRMCVECDYRSEYCGFACTGALMQDSFPEGCEPLVHDGEVCLRALESAGCGEYEDYVKDAGRQAPSECLFCPWNTP
jgi:hypothetical protein